MPRFKSLHFLWYFLSGALLLCVGSRSLAQVTITVTATASSTTPDWTAADGSHRSQTPLDASCSISPMPEGSDICPPGGTPTWSWTITRLQYSSDGVSYNDSGSGCSYWVCQPSTSSPSATLKATYTVGGYWIFTLQASVSYNPVCDKGVCDCTQILSFVGGGSAQATAKSVALMNLTVTDGRSRPTWRF